MTIVKPTVPANEMERLLSLSGFDVDFAAHKNNFKDLAELAAKITGTNISLVNLLDSYTQWTLSSHGLDLEQMLREDSACQYTIMTDDHFEVGDMSRDDRFKDKFYVKGEPLARYYLGVPLKIAPGINIGALCVLDQERKIVDSEKVALLKIIADEIVNKLKTIKVLESLNIRLNEAERAKLRAAHDIRGPLAGIIGLTEILTNQGVDNDMSEVLEFVSVIGQSSQSLIEMTDKILNDAKTQKVASEDGLIFNLLKLQSKLEKLYKPQALQKNINFKIDITSDSASVTIPGDNLLQIAGNLISNAFKFTPDYGSVSVSLSLSERKPNRVLRIEVKDSGVGISEELITAIFQGKAYSTEGTMGEAGFGFGLALVKHLIEDAGGTLQLASIPGNGTTFTVDITQPEGY